LRLNKTQYSILLLFFIIVLNKANLVLAKQNMTKDWSFVENKGQLAASNLKGSQWGNAKYYAYGDGIFVFCIPGKISFVFAKNENRDAHISEATATSLLSPAGGGREWKNVSSFSPSKLILNRIDLILYGSNPDAEITAMDQQAYYENFYTSTLPNEGITDVHTYKTITYNNIYPYIDMVLHCKEGGMKYEFVVWPGGKVSDIQMQWNGLRKIAMASNGGIFYHFSLGNITETAPFTYLPSDLNNNLCRNCGLEPQSPQSNVSRKPNTDFSIKTPIPSNFVLKNNRISFRIKHYDNTKPLIIDPTLSWGTYFGGSGIDQSECMATDATGNILITGYTRSANSMANSGAFQTSLAGVQDVFVSKFSTVGTRLWSTYFGNGTSIGGSIATDASGNVLVNGTTGDASGIASTGAFQTSLSGDTLTDAFIAKFTPNGSRIWSTYFGGKSGEVGGGIATDASNNVFILGYTNSKNDIASTGVYQTIYGGDTDVFFAKFSPNGSRIWSTYFGGPGQDDVRAAGIPIAVDAVGNIFIVCTTSSSTGIASAGAYQTSFGGKEDACIAKFSSSGSLIWSTYFGGNGYDGFFGIHIDINSNVMVVGAASTTGLATSGAYQTSYGGGSSDAFLAKFSNSGNLIWGTYFGGSQIDGGIGIATDASGNIFLAGYTLSSSDIVTSGAYQTKFGGTADALLAEFSTSGNRLYSTYYGGTGDEISDGIALDKFGNVFITGYSNGNTSGIATSGAYQTSFGGGIDDAFIAKFSFKIDNDAGIANILNPITNLCAGSQPITLKLRNYGLQELDKVSIGWSINHKNQTPYTWTGKLATDSAVSVSLGSYAFTPGTDTLRAWTSLPNGQTDSMPGNDTARVTDTIWAAPNTHFSISYAGPATYLHATDSSMADTVYQWALGDANTGTGHLVKHVYAHNTIYNISLKITNAAGCESEFDSAVNITSSGINSQLVLDNLGFNIYPNPFYTITKLEYNLIKTTDISISIFDAGGKEINIMPTQMQSPGKYQVDINAEKYHLAAGTYVLRMMVGDGEVRRKMVVGK